MEIYMKRFFLICLVVVLHFTTNAQTWKVDKNNTRIGFTAIHLLISEVHGSFTSFTVTLVSAKDDFTDAQIEVVADVASLTTNVEMRDKNLKSPYYFDAEKFPKLTFKSESLARIDGKKYNLQGTLTIHGVSKTVNLDVTFNGTATSPVNKMTVAGFKITGVVKRSDFKMREDAVGVRDEIKIDVDAEFFKVPK
jgi:polyisoprenoid-binding protein YceI